MGNAKRRVSAKRKRRFRSNGSTIKHSKNSSATSTNASSSKIKIPAAFDEEIAEYQRKQLTGNRIIDMEVLLNLFLQLCCPRCFEEGILLFEDSTYGLCSNFVIRCKHSDFYSGFSSSKKTLNCPEKLVNYQCKKQLLRELLVLHPTKNKIVECGISVDGTWQRRGYSSMNGCVAALSVDTGKVVDIEIMSSYCPTCRKISKMPRSIESETLQQITCHSNFQGSALKMEAVGATRIFQRSIVKRGLKYAHYYGDGDSKGFISVKDTYGKDSVTKYECIGHVQKRVDVRLRKLKSKNKNLSGKGKLTDSFIDRLENYYGIAVRSNVGNLSGLQQNVIAALFHCSSSVEKPIHGQCPIGKDS
ncbi:CCHC-type domain-containing protein [Trichonephila clavipes]|nr:CCHC-type domain-containing protein [Trichonephila clavipes]